MDSNWQRLAYHRDLQAVLSEYVHYASCLQDDSGFLLYLSNKWHKIMTLRELSMS